MENNLMHSLFRVASLKKIFANSFSLVFLLVVVIPLNANTACPPKNTDFINSDAPQRLQRIIDIAEKHKTDDAAMCLLIQALSDPVPSIQSEAMFILKTFGNRVIPELKSEKQSWRALYLLAYNKMSSIIPVLKSHLNQKTKHDYPETFYGSLYALGLIGEENEVKFLLNALHDVGPLLIITLSQITKRDLNKFLMGVYLADPLYQTNTARIVVSVLSKFNITSSVILSLLNRKHPAFQTAALFMIRHVKASGIRSIIKQALKSPYASVQRQAIQCISDYKMEDLYRILPKLIQPRMPDVTQMTAIETMLLHLPIFSEKEKRMFENKMVALSKQNNTILKNTAIKALAQINTK